MVDLQILGVHAPHSPASSGCLYLTTVYLSPAYLLMVNLNLTIFSVNPHTFLKRNRGKVR